jgi:hypothetical protein
MVWCVMIWSSKSPYWQMYGGSRNEAEMRALYAEMVIRAKTDPSIYGVRLDCHVEEWIAPKR